MCPVNGLGAGAQYCLRLTKRWLLLLQLGNMTVGTGYYLLPLRIRGRSRNVCTSGNKRKPGGWFLFFFSQQRGNPLLTLYSSATAVYDQTAVTSVWFRNWTLRQVFTISIFYRQFWIIMVLVRLTPRACVNLEQPSLTTPEAESAGNALAFLSR